MNRRLQHAVIVILLVAGPATGAPAGAKPVNPAPSPAPLSAPAADPACLARFSVVGLPRHRGDDAPAGRAGALICRQGYALSYDTLTHDPDWVVERLNPGVLTGKAVRSNAFGPDPVLGADSPVAGDYTNTGFDRGHQAPAADSRFSQAVEDESFYMSNMAPQVGIGFNRGQWKYLEEAVRSWVLCGGRADVVVITGPIYGAGTHTISAKRIVVPDAFYKIVYDVKQGRAVGFRLENRRYAKTDLQALVVPIAQIEDESGLDFFAALPRRTQTQLETPKGIIWGHGQACNNVAE